MLITILVMSGLVFIYDWFMVRPARRVTFHVYREHYKFFKRKI